jgi:hypothetical protein
MTSIATSLRFILPQLTPVANGSVFRLLRS